MSRRRPAASVDPEAELVDELDCFGSARDAGDDTPPRPARCGPRHPVRPASVPDQCWTDQI
jgi:hypothetical protein